MELERTDYCGSLREKDIGRAVTVMGWVQHKRDMGGVIFIDLRDREGTLQVVFDQKNIPAAEFERAESLRIESVIAVSGQIELRGEDTLNPRLETGTIELRAQRLEVLSQADTLPFSLDDGASVREELRLRYRFLDLRRPAMIRNLRFRHQTLKVIREYLDRRGFVEVETPMLTKSTPEGARDYLVPSRLHPGAFYALPQSPQIFKQLLMVGGVDRYYQVARCFRDEDLRADRQPEFTQVDMELSFVKQEHILNELEGLFKHVFDKMLGIRFEEPFLRLTWRQAMDTYGSDKPDLRFGLPIVDLTELLRGCSFEVFRKALDAGGVVRAINAKGCAGFTRGEIEELTKKAISYGAKGMAWIAVRENGEIYSILTKYLSEKQLSGLLSAMDAKAGDFILFCADSLSTVRRTLGGLRLDLAELLGLRKKGEYSFLIVTDFPQFEYSAEEGRWIAMHHPFTMPYPEDLPYLLTDPGRVRAQAYDFILNGVELGSGSLRIYDRKVQQRMFEALGFSKEEAEERFGFMMGAFRYGTPPHGGFAFGLDRLVMLMAGADSLRDIIAFPKARDASCPMTGAPGFVDEAQLAELNLTGAAGGGTDSGGKRRSARNAPRIDVDNVADLALLSLDESEKEAIRADLEAIVAFADELAGLDTEGVPVTAHVAPIENVLRADECVPSYDRDTLLQNAPSKEGGYLYVPKVVEG